VLAQMVDDESRRPCGRRVVAHLVRKARRLDPRSRPRIVETRLHPAERRRLRNRTELRPHEHVPIAGDGKETIERVNETKVVVGWRRGANRKIKSEPAGRAPVTGVPFYRRRARRSMSSRLCLVQATIGSAKDPMKPTALEDE